MLYLTLSHDTRNWWYTLCNEIKRQLYYVHVSRVTPCDSSHFSFGFVSKGRNISNAMFDGPRLCARELSMFGVPMAECWEKGTYCWDWYTIAATLQQQDWVEPRVWALKALHLWQSAGASLCYQSHWQVLDVRVPLTFSLDPYITRHIIGPHIVITWHIHYIHLDTLSLVPYLPSQYQRCSSLRPVPASVGPPFIGSAYTSNWFRYVPFVKG
jgi:hypothetical protein